MALIVAALSIELIEELRPLMSRIKARDKSLEDQIRRAARETMAALRVAIGWGYCFEERGGASGGAAHADYSDALEADALMRVQWRTARVREGWARLWFLRSVSRAPVACSCSRLAIEVRPLHLRRPFRPQLLRPHPLRGTSPPRGRRVRSCRRKLR